jgi:hypothetical protein
MKFPGIHSAETSKSPVTPDVTAEVMGRLGFSGVNESPQSLKRARHRYQVKRLGAFSCLVLLILGAALLERRFSQEPEVEEVITAEDSNGSDRTAVNAYSALQAVFQRFDSSLSAAEAGEMPAAQLSTDEAQDVPPLEGPILVPGYFGDASASLTSS